MHRNSTIGDSTNFNPFEVKPSAWGDGLYSQRPASQAIHPQVPPLSYNLEPINKASIPDDLHDDYTGYVGQAQNFVGISKPNLNPAQQLRGTLAICMMCCIV